MAGTISMDGGSGFASCRTIIDTMSKKDLDVHGWDAALDMSSPTLGFSDDTVALKLEVTGDGQRYKVGVREKDGSFQPTWQVSFAFFFGGVLWLFCRFLGV